MTSETIFSNGRIVLADRVVAGSVAVRDGAIWAIDDGPTAAAGAIDLGGDWLIPGMIELHTDNLEVHIAPRPTVTWPTLPALLAHDSQMAAAGITTAFDALRVGDRAGTGTRANLLQETVDQLHGLATQGLLRIDHRLHMRCEVQWENTLPTMQQFIDEPLVRLVSVMDHTPGQRQFRDLKTWRKYHGKRFGKSDAELDEHIEVLKANQAIYAERNRRAIAEMCQDRALVMASHDDTTEAHVEAAAELGIAISEFPTTVAAAAAAHRCDMATIGGAPNVVCGGSHSGNVSASELAEGGLLDALSSDYVPMSLLHSAYLLHAKPAMALPEAIAMVSRNPARMVGFDDRGEIAVGKRADLVQVTPNGEIPVIRQVWRLGARIA